MKSFHLRWASHLPNMGTVFASLYQTEGLSDVCLSCSDGSLRAHKLILSTCSDYFLDLFLESQSKRTVVMLPGVKLAHLRTLLGFIYTGEVKVSEDELPDLLEVAEMLGVLDLRPTRMTKTMKRKKMEKRKPNQIKMEIQRTLPRKKIAQRRKQKASRI